MATRFPNRTACANIWTPRYPRMDSLLADYRKSVRSYECEWKLLGQTLYRLCQENPQHSNSGVVNAKLWLIGRTFQTGVERHVKSSGGMGSSLDKMAKHLLRNGRKVDRLIKDVSALGEPLDLEKLSAIVRVHGTFCELVSRIANGRKQLVSFASKYLHCHAPVVPIYDGWAFGQAWRMRRKQDVRCFQRPPGAKDNYYWYCLCFWQVYSNLQTATKDVNVRLVENFLTWLAHL